jgi:hypothetical protein
VGGLFLKSLVNTLFFEYQFLETLIHISKHICEDLKSKEMLDLYKQETWIVREELKNDITELLIEEDSFITQCNGYVKFIKTKMAAYHILNYQREQLEKFEKLGMVDTGEKNNWSS